MKRPATWTGINTYEVTVDAVYEGLVEARSSFQARRIYARHLACAYENVAAKIVACGWHAS